MAWRIDDRLWVSGRPSLNTLAQTGATAVLTVCPKTPPAEVIMSTQVEWWKHMPLSDGKRLKPEQYFAATDTAGKMLDAGHTVLVHCMAGRNRSCLIAALVLRERYGAPGVHVAEIVRERRPRALDNPAQYEWLVSLP